MDNSGGEKLAKTVGKIIAPNITVSEFDLNIVALLLKLYFFKSIKLYKSAIKKAVPIPAGSGQPPSASKAATSALAKTKEEDKPMNVAQASPEKEKPKMTGKLDFSKARTKETKKASLKPEANDTKSAATNKNLTKAESKPPIKEQHIPDEKIVVSVLKRFLNTDIILSLVHKATREETQVRCYELERGGNRDGV